ncbi:MAG: amidohydrolase family protein [Candidatus Nanoarchaeia archaeon]|jgi:cytosine/adenosine deaminase-related metal-dependent hydrolase
MILNNITILKGGRLIKTDIFFDQSVHYIKNNLSKGVDCTGLFLLPGLTNAHVHLGSRAVSGAALGLKKYEYFDNIGFKVHDRRKTIDVYKASLLACLESIKEGVTHVDTMDMNPEPVIKAINKCKLGYTACLAVKDAHKEKSSISKQFNQTLELKKKYGNKIMLGLANEYECTPQLIKEGLLFAQENDLPIHMHACETLEDVKHIKKLTGMRTIDYLNSLGMLEHDLRLAHCTYADSKDILMLAENNVQVMHCPTSNKAISDNAPPNKVMLNNNVKMLLGTDSYAWNPSSSILNEAWESYELTGVTINQAYTMTHEPFGPESEASFSLIDMSQLKPFKTVSEFVAKIMNKNAIKSVYLKGKEIVRDGKNLLGINEEKLRNEVTKIRERLIT